MPSVSNFMTIFALLAAANVVTADLGAAVRKKAALSSSAAAPPLPFQAPLNGPLVIPLAHVSESVPTATGNIESSFYLGTLSVGHPLQKLKVMFDTASGSVIVPHRACKSEACLSHKRYSPWESVTAMDVRSDGEPVVNNTRFAPGNSMRDGAMIGFTHADLGEGNVHAVLVRDGVCLSNGVGESCVDMSVLAAVQLDDTPFKDMPSDAIVGLGLESLTLTPLCSFLGRLFEGSSNVVPMFGMALHPLGGELYLGGYNAARTAAPVTWLPIDHPEAGYWQVALQAVRVGNRTVDACASGCHAVVDTAASRLGVQASRLPSLQAALTTMAGPRGACFGPELHFDLGDITITLQPEDYTDDICKTQLGNLALEEPEFVGVYTFGEKVLRRYYAAFDWEKKRVGFAPARHATEEDNLIVA
mmetsp:Transcript_45187/g.104725  ORF Transcript_45187/g.104725 Transcript_45187/m.104725 type:complete len:417 (+) Transcript_45187:113-1363(+)